MSDKVKQIKYVLDLDERAFRIHFQKAVKKLSLNSAGFRKKLRPVFVRFMKRQKKKVAKITPKKTGDAAKAWGHKAMKRSRVRYGYYLHNKQRQDTGNFYLGYVNYGTGQRETKDPVFIPFLGVSTTNRGSIKKGNHVLNNYLRSTKQQMERSMKIGLIEAIKKV